MMKKPSKTPSSCLHGLFIFRGFGSPVLPCHKVKNKSTRRGGEGRRDYVTGAPCERGTVAELDALIGGKTVGVRVPEVHGGLF